MTEPTDYEMQRSIAADVLTKAGSRALSARRDSGLTLKKGDFHDVVTEVDKVVQREVLETLKRIFPTYGYLAEEGELSQAGEFRWVLDPIDGTKNYSRGLPLWGLSLALLRNNQAVVGVIVIPENSETYSASLGGPAYRNGVAISPHKPHSLEESLIAVTWGKTVAHRTRMLKAIERLVPLASDVLSVGTSAITLSWLAAGKVDAVVDCGDLWDFAAGFLIAKQMGAVVTEWDGSRPTFRERDFFTLVSSHQALHDRLVALLHGL